jgi:hypothetical protein
MVVVFALGGDPHNAVAAIRGHSFGEGHGRNSEQNAALLVSVDVMGKRTEKGGKFTSVWILRTIYFTASYHAVNENIEGDRCRWLCWKFRGFRQIMKDVALAL